MRNDTRSGYVLTRGISNLQWAQNQAMQGLVAAQKDSAGLDPTARAERLDRAITEAIDYLTKKVRPDPEPGEGRLWHTPHAPGEPCPFHDGKLSRGAR
jgi:hypothetical protein